MSTDWIMNSVGVVIGTYGDLTLWQDLITRAVRSVRNQTVKADSVSTVHGTSLANARNTGAAAVKTDLFIFLDADDELDPGYIQAMKETASLRQGHFILRPATLGFYEDGSEDDEPVMIPRTDMRTSNCAVIGSCVRSETFAAAGGFREYSALEDWALWRTMMANGAELVDVPAAIYRVGVREGSRNADSKIHGDAYRRILREVPL